MPRASIPALLAAPAPTFSFEFFPPKDDAAEETLWHAIRRLEPLAPAFVSVTYGAGGTTRDRTVRVTERIAHETTMRPMAHLTTVSSSVDELRAVIGQYAAGGVRNVLALRGDPPGGPGAPWPSHPEGLDHAEDLVRLVRSLGDFTVGVAAFPDKHPEAADLEVDADVLARKFDAGAEFAVTQFVFDAGAYARLRDRLASRGYDRPIVPGLMPVTAYGQVARMAQLAGTPLPEDVVRRLEPLAQDPAALQAEGVAVATELGAQLLAEGAPGLHFYTMNRSTATLRVYRNLRGDLADVAGEWVDEGASAPPATPTVIGRRFIEAVASGDLARLDELTAPEVTVVWPGRGERIDSRGEGLRTLMSKVGDVRVERVVGDAARQVAVWASAAGGVPRQDVYFLTLDGAGLVSGVAVLS